MRHFNQESYDKLIKILQKKFRAGEAPEEDLDQLNWCMEVILDYYTDRCTTGVRKIIRDEVEREQDTIVVIQAISGLDKLAKKYGLDPIYKIKSVNDKDVNAFCLELALSLYAAGL